MKKIIVVMALMALAAGAMAEMRTWTLVNGTTVKGEFKEMKADEKTGKMCVYLILEDGKPRSIVLARLSEADQAVAKQLAGQ